MGEGLKLFRRTSGRHFNLASFHSPHSLTWSWILGLTILPFAAPRLCFYRSDAPSFPCFVFGVTGLLGLSMRRDNNGWQWSLWMLWLSIDWHRQQPMWFRDLYQRAEDERSQAHFGANA